MRSCHPLTIRLAPIDNASLRSRHTNRFKLPRSNSHPQKKATFEGVAFIVKIKSLFDSSLFSRPSSLGRSTDLGFGGGTHHKLLFCRLCNQSFRRSLGLRSFHLSPCRFLSSGNFSRTSRTQVVQLVGMRGLIMVSTPRSPSKAISVKA